MAKDRGWWKLESTVELSDSDREHIAEMIIKGYIEGEVCRDEEPEDGQDYQS